jgi:hypothetical protein
LLRYWRLIFQMKRGEGARRRGCRRWCCAKALRGRERRRHSIRAPCGSLLLLLLLGLLLLSTRTANGIPTELRGGTASVHRNSQQSPLNEKNKDAQPRPVCAQFYAPRLWFYVLPPMRAVALVLRFPPPSCRRPHQHAPRPRPHSSSLPSRFSFITSCPMFRKVSTILY